MRALLTHPAVWGVLAVLLLTSFWIDLENVRAGGSIDLRNRVTGARLLLAHIDPYFYKWQEPEPPEYCDPHNNPHVPVSKTTATPALLLLGAPFAELPYRVGQFAWLAAQWMLLLGTGWIWWRRLALGWPRILLAAFLVGFTFTSAWRLHAERGQSYVLLLCLFAAWLALTLSNRDARTRSFLTGMLAGLLMALRPPFLLLVPFLALHRKAQLPGVALGLLLAVVLPMFWRGDAWVKYSAAMAVNSEIYRSGPEPRPGPERFPSEIEGISTDVLAAFATIPYADFSFHGLLTALRLEPFPEGPPLIGIALLFLGWLWWLRRQPLPRVLLGVAVWYFAADLFLPAYRNTYNDVLVINVFALGLMMSPRLAPGMWFCLLALPLGWSILYFLPEDARLIDLPSALYTLGAALFVCRPQTVRIVQPKAQPE